MKLSEFSKNFKDEERVDNLINKNGSSEKSEKNAEKLRNFQKNEAFNGDFYANSNFQSEKNTYKNINFQSENEMCKNEKGDAHFKSERQSDANFGKDFQGNQRGVNFDAEKETLNKRYDEIKNLPYEDLLLQFKNEVQKQKDAGEFDYDALRTSVEAVKMFVPTETYENMRRLLDEIED